MMDMLIIKNNLLFDQNSLEPTSLFISLPYGMEATWKVMPVN